MKKEIELSKVLNWYQNYQADKKNRFVQNAVAENELKVVAVDHEIVKESQMAFSDEITTGDIQAQNKSGRCWIFSALNFLRARTIKEKNLNGDFTFSPVYIYFWDKLEKSNFFLEEVIEGGEAYLDSIPGKTKLMYPAGESGQWFMFCNLVKKYGLVPLEIMPETYHSSNSQDMVRYLGHILRNAAAELQERQKAGSTKNELEERKEQILEKVYQYLCHTLGTPPVEFSYDYYDKDKNYQHIEKITPLQFAQEFWSGNLDEYVCVSNAPGTARPYHQTFTLEHFGNVYEGNRSLYYNIEMDAIKPMLCQQIHDGESVWFGCDCMNMMDRWKGIMNDRLYGFDELFDVEYVMDKKQMLDYMESSPNHNMVIVGVKQYEDGRRYWKVENSWGCEAGQKGYYIMNEGYLDRYASEFIIHKKYLNADQLKELQKPPVVLPFNDPLGA